MNIQKLRAAIDHTRAAGLSPTGTIDCLSEALEEFVAGADVSSVERCFTSKSLYRRQRLSAPEDDFHIVMAIWRPNSSSPIHYHDETTGVVTTLIGTTIERKYEKVAALGQYHYLEAGPAEVLEAKTISPILPESEGAQLHAMHNPYDVWAATLHVYLHPLTQFNLYHAQAGELYTQTAEKLWFDTETMLTPSSHSSKRSASSSTTFALSSLSRSA